MNIREYELVLRGQDGNEDLYMDKRGDYYVYVENLIKIGDKIEMRGQMYRLEVWREIDGF